MSRRVIVVGAGPGGLAAAMLLAASGVRVRVIERLPHVGGRTSSLEHDGFRFDLGPTFFLYPRILAEIFATAGYDLENEIELRRVDPQYRLVFGEHGGELLAASDLGKLESEVAKLSPGDAKRIATFIRDNRHKFERFRPILQSPFSSWTDLARLDLLRLLPLLRPWRSLDAELARYFRDPRVRLAFSFQSKYLGMSPFNCPSLFSILSYLEYDFGVFHPVGGCGQVSRRMAEIIEEMGGEVITGQPVDEIVFEGRRAVGVRLNDRVERADAVIVNADFARAMTRLVDERVRPRWSDRAIERKRFSCSTFMLYLGIDGRYEDVSHHTIYLSNDYVRNLDDIERRHVLSDDPSYYVQNACVTDPSLAPRDASTLYVLVPVTHERGTIDWRREAPRFRDRVIERLAAVGIRDVANRIHFERVISPSDWSQDYEIHRGATFNLAHSLDQMLHLRPHNRFEGTEGLYLVGGGTHPGSGLPVIYESARISTKLLMDDLGIAPLTRSVGRVPLSAQTLATNGVG